MAYPHHSHQGPKFPGVCRLLLPVHPRFMQVACLLHELMSSENVGKEKVAITWNDSCQQSCNNLRHLCTIAPILAYADFKRPFKLHTNACGSGLGVVFYETCDDGTDAVIAHASRSLMMAETNYPNHKVEFPTLKWAMVEKFHEYLYGMTFDIYTDNNPLTCANDRKAGCHESAVGGQPYQL